MDNRQRLLSLDALRGFDMVWLIGLAAAVRAFCGAFPGGDEWWLARQMHHCSWEGFVRWSYPLRIVGMNSLAAYLSPYFLDFMKPSGFLLGGIASLVPCGGFVLALGAFFFAWLFLWLLHRANIFIRA